MQHDGAIDAAVGRARSLAMAGDGEAAKQAYLEALRLDPTRFDVLNDMGALTYASGHRTAARTVCRQAVQCHPSNPIGRVNLANILAEDGDHLAAQAQYQAALEVDPDFPHAHQGLARIFSELGDARAEQHRRKGFIGHAIDQRRYRGVAPGAPALLPATTHLGKLPTQQWIDDRIFAVTVVYVEFWDASQPLPTHALIVNAIGDADLCGEALTRCSPIVRLPSSTRRHSCGRPAAPTMRGAWPRYPAS